MAVSVSKSDQIQENSNQAWACIHNNLYVQNWTITQFQAEASSLCHALVVTMVTAHLLWLHVWYSMHLANDCLKGIALHYIYYTVGSNNKRDRE